jgi:Virulence activator alpha C-term
MALESEHLVKLFFADHGRTQDALATLQATKAWALEQLDVFAEAVRAYLAGEGEFRQRAAVNMVGARFMVDFYAMVADWTDGASEVVAPGPITPTTPSRIGNSWRRSIGEPVLGRLRSDRRALAVILAAVRSVRPFAPASVVHGKAPPRRPAGRLSASATHPVCVMAAGSERSSAAAALAGRLAPAGRPNGCAPPCPGWRNP